MIYIIILNWNNARDTIKCLESLKLIRDELFKVIVCDNKSTDNSYAVLSNYANKNKNLDIIAIQSPMNGGFAYGNNFALKKALEDPDAEYFWLLNNDTIVTPNALSSLKKKSSESENNGICGSTLIYEHDRNTIQGIGGKYNNWLGTTSHLLQGSTYDRATCFSYESVEFDYVIGASMFVTRKYLEAVGLMYENYFLYFEEIDWCTRGRSMGFRLAYASNSLVYHKEGGTTNTKSEKFKRRNSNIDFYSLRAPLIFTKKFYKSHYPLIRILYAGRALKRFVAGDFSGARRALLFLFRGENLQQNKG
jgi:GT2 family glycosyltransferase